MDISFAVAGLLLNALHFPDGEGAEFELGIRVVMKRRKENGARQRCMVAHYSNMQDLS
jgi:hypothetical protein